MKQTAEKRSLLQKTDPTAWTALFYFAGITLGEVFTTRDRPFVGLILHGLMLVLLILQGAVSKRRVAQRFYFSLALVPLIRLMSLSLPLTDYPFVYWYLIIGAPLFLAAFFTARIMGLSIDRLVFNLRKPLVQVLVALSGALLGYMEYVILRPQPLVAAFTFQEVWQPALILLIFTGLLEEVIFRGLLQQAAREHIGRWGGMIFAALLFAVMHLGYHSLFDFLFVLAVALYFGLVVQKTGSILGVTLAHGLTNIGLFLIFPFLAVSASLPVRQWLPEPAAPAMTATVPAPTAAPATATWTPVPTRTSTPIPPTPSPTPTEIPLTPSATLAIAPTWTSTPGAPLSPFQQQMTEVGVQVPNAQIIMVDDGDRGFLRSGGTTWLSGNGLGGDLVWASPTTGEADAMVEWQPVILVGGRYEVQVFCPREYASLRFARYEVGSLSGVKTVVLDQSAHQGEWASLGIFSFAPGETAFLRLSNHTISQPGLDEVVGFDAARWLLIPEAD
jgi:membrane protease YdiL (CAAX protease family)